MTLTRVRSRRIYFSTPVRRKTQTNESAATVPHVAVAILNWNGLIHLQTYLPSVVVHSISIADEIEVRVVLIDNGSTDGSIGWVTSEFPEIQIIRLSKNHGFAGGYNKGFSELRKIGSDSSRPWTHYVLLNSDVRATAGWIPPVLQAMATEGFTACQPIIRSDKRNENFEYAGAAGGYIDRDGFTFCAGRIFDAYESDTNQYPGNREIFWASGASLFIEAAAFHEVNGLDADFFAHMEEIDLCWRLKNRGHRIGVCGTSVVFHLGGGTLKKVSSFKTYLNFRNNLFLLVKNHHRKWLLPMLFRRMILDGIAALKFAASGEWTLFFAVWKAHLSFYVALPATFRKRRLEIQSSRTRNYIGWYHRSILLEYFSRGKRKFSELDPNAFSRS